MSTADKLNKLLETKQAIKQAIINKGVDVSDDTVFADYPGKIESIISEGSDPIYEYLWNTATENNTNYQYLYYYYTGTELDLSKLDTSKVTDMRYMFYGCSKLTSIRGIDNWDTSNVTRMTNMFYYCSKLTSLDVSNWDTSNVTSMQAMFQSCQSLTSLDVSNWDTSKVTDIYYMFYNCTGLTSLDVSNFDVGKITSNYSLDGAFNSCTSLVDFYPPQNINGPMSVSQSKALSHDSLVRILNNLMEQTSTKKLTLGPENLAKLSDDEKQIATSKGWTLA